MNRALSLLVILFFSVQMTSGFAQDAVKGKVLYTTCIQCHGENGEGNPTQLGPKISGQHDWYVIKQVTEIKSGVRKNPTMLPFILKLTEEDIKDLAAYIVTL